MLLQTHLSVFILWNKKGDFYIFFLSGHTFPYI